MHVYQRTISGFNLFYTMEDFLVFYTIVSIQARRVGICILGMCLMIDHVHMLVSSECLSMMSRFINSCTSIYVREFNACTGRQGPLFEQIKKIHESRGRNFQTQEVPESCTSEHHDERPHIRGEKQACGPYHFHIFPFRHQKNNRLLRII